MGLQYGEILSGRYTLANRPAEEHPLTLDLLVELPSLLGRERGGGRVSGTVEMPGFATAAAVRGELVARPLAARALRYELAFRGDDGDEYRFSGKKQIDFRHLGESLQVLRGAIHDSSGRRIAAAVCRFDTRADLLAMLSSVRRG